ncbi:MAG: 4-hydroxybenzoate octaprenyltransferase, partial [Alphaproteobacteria bacterium]|nr:4-hydroxybenzoate octaprenyltransferase [Alphaproteobacteria bacterium]
LALTGWLGAAAWPYWIALAAAAGHLAGQAMRVDFADPGSCQMHFKANRSFGLILLAGIVAARVVG